MRCKCLGILPFLNQEQLVAVINGPVVVILDITCFSLAGGSDSFSHDRFQELFPHFRFTFVSHINYNHFFPPLLKILFS